jgi:hypothetical protein
MYPMKIKALTLALAGSSAILFSCGPAAEDRNAMHARAKVIQDSMANAIRQAIAEAEAPANTAVHVDTAARPAPSPSATGK